MGKKNARVGPTSRNRRRAAIAAKQNGAKAFAPRRKRSG